MPQVCQNRVDLSYLAQRRSEARICKLLKNRCAFDAVDLLKTWEMLQQQARFSSEEFHPFHQELKFKKLSGADSVPR